MQTSSYKIDAMPMKLSDRNFVGINVVSLTEWVSQGKVKAWHLEPEIWAELLLSGSHNTLLREKVVTPDKFQQDTVSTRSGIF